MSVPKLPDSKDIWADDPVLEALGDEINTLSADDIEQRTRLLENDIKVMKSETMRLSHEQQTLKERIKDNNEKIKLNKQLPYLVGNIVEVCEHRSVFHKAHVF